MRIGLGAVGLGSGLAKAGDVQRLFGREGIGSWRWTGPPPIVPGSQSPLAELLGASLQSAPPGLVSVLFVAMLFAALAFALGAWTRVSGIALLVLHAIFHARNEFAYAGSWADMYKAFLLYTILAPTGRYLSVDAWRRRRLHPDEPAPGWDGPAIPVRDWFPFLMPLRLMSYVAFVLEPLAPSCSGRPWLASARRTPGPAGGGPLIPLVELGSQALCVIATLSLARQPGEEGERGNPFPPRDRFSPSGLTIRVLSGVRDWLGNPA